MIANLNVEQTDALRYLLTEHPGDSIRIEGGEGGSRHVTFRHMDVTYRLEIDGDIQGAVPAP